MDAAVKLFAVVCCLYMSLLTAGVSASDGNDDFNFQYIVEKDDDSFALDKGIAERSGQDTTFIRHRDSYAIIEAPGESEKFFSKYNPQQLARSHDEGKTTLMKNIVIDLGHKGPVFDENKNLILSAEFLQRVVKKIKVKVKLKYKKGQKVPHLIVFPKGGKLGLPYPVFITWKPYSIKDCLIPFCNPQTEAKVSIPVPPVPAAPYKPVNKYKYGSLKKTGSMKIPSKFFTAAHFASGSGTKNKIGASVKGSKDNFMTGFSILGSGNESKNLKGNKKLNTGKGQSSVQYSQFKSPKFNIKFPSAKLNVKTGFKGSSKKFKNLKLSNVGKEHSGIKYPNIKVKGPKFSISVRRPKLNIKTGLKGSSKKFKSLKLSKIGKGPSGIKYSNTKIKGPKISSKVPSHKTNINFGLKGLRPGKKNKNMIYGNKIKVGKGKFNVEYPNFKRPKVSIKVPSSKQNFKTGFKGMVKDNKIKKLKFGKKLSVGKGEYNEKHPNFKTPQINVQITRPKGIKTGLPRLGTGKKFKNLKLRNKLEKGKGEFNVKYPNFEIPKINVKVPTPQKIKSGFKVPQIKPVDIKIKPIKPIKDAQVNNAKLFGKLKGTAGKFSVQLNDLKTGKKVNAFKVKSQPGMQIHPLSINSQWYSGEPGRKNKPLTVGIEKIVIEEGPEKLKTSQLSGKAKQSAGKEPRV